MFHMILSTVETSFPAESLYSRMASDVRTEFHSEDAEERLAKLASEMFESMPKDSSARKMLLASLHMFEPFNMHPSLTKKIIEDYSQ